MSFWVCVETNFAIEKLSPNNGWPFCVESASKPYYIRVHGPYEDDTEFFGTEKCERNKVYPVTTEYPPDTAYPDASKNPLNWTTRGWYAHCPYNRKASDVVVSFLDYPPVRTQSSKCVGPYDTEAEAKEITAQWSCAIVYTPAIDICDPTPKASSIQELECSLVCSSLAWPFKSGTLQVSFFDKECFTNLAVPSPCSPPTVNINLGCPPSLTPPATSSWSGMAPSYQVTMIQNPPRGYRIRLYGSMTVQPNPNYVTASFTMEALMLASDINPSAPDDLPRWVGCGSLTATLPVVSTSLNKRDPRIYSGNLQAFSPSCGGLAECIGAVRLTVVLLPWKFGCDGSIGSGGMAPAASQSCGLFSSEKAYSCASAIMLPLDSTTATPKFRPQFVQLGLNTNGNTEEHGCFYCIGGGNSWQCDPLPKFVTSRDLCVIGIPGEESSTIQQIQMGQGPSGTVMLKRVGGGLWVCLQGDAGRWVYTSADLRQRRVPMVLDASFPEFNTRILIYILEFPSPEIGGCITGGDTYPPLPLPPGPTNGLVSDSPTDFLVWDGPDDYLLWDVEPMLMLPPSEPMEVMEVAPTAAMIDHRTMLERIRLPCIHRGADLEKVADCGCSGQPMKECAVKGVCRILGASWDTRPMSLDKPEIQLCISCDQYERAE